MPPKLLTTDEAAAMLGVKSKTLATWRWTGKVKLPYVKVGDTVRYKLADLEKWIEKQTVKA